MNGFKAIRFRKVRRFGDKVNVTFEFIRQNFKSLFKSMIIIAGPFLVVGSLFLSQVFLEFFNFSSTFQQGISDFDLIMKIGGSILAFVLFTMLGGTAIISVIYNYMVLYEDKSTDKIEIHQVWKKVKKTFLPVLGTICLYGIVVILSYIFIILPFTLLLTAIPGLFLIAIIIFYAGFIYISITFMLILFIRIYENIGIGSAFKRAFYLIRGKWWSTFGLLLVMTIIHGFVAGIFMVPWYANFIIYILHNTNTDTLAEPYMAFSIVNHLTFLFYTLASYLLYCIPLIALAFQYFNLVEIKDATGLLEKIKTIGVEEKKEGEDEFY